MEPAKQSTPLSAIHRLAAEGKMQAARAELERLDAHLPRTEVWVLASLLRRVNWSERAVKLLHPLVRGSNKQPADASPFEKAEYAANLNRVGSQREANALLEEVSPDTFPLHPLYQSFLHASQWEYEQRAQCLKRFLKGESLGYETYVAKVNLVDTLVYLRHHQQVRPLLSSLIHDTSTRKYHLLHGNLLQIAGMDCVLRKDFQSAEDFFSRASRILAQTDVNDALFLKKWRAISCLLQNREGALEQIHEVRNQAIQAEHWETIRDCDRFVAIERRDTALLTQIFFGTPHSAFRQRLLSDYPDAFDPPSDYRWVPGTPGPHELDLVRGEMDGTPIKGLLLTLLRSFAEDFYRPLTLPGLFHRIYPDEKFHPLHSPLRVHQALNRLRNELRGSSLDVEWDGSHYRLKADGFAIRVGRESNEDPSLAKLQEHFGNRPFSAPEAAELLGESPRTARRRLGQSPQVNRQGRGKATRYQIK